MCYRRRRFFNDWHEIVLPGVCPTFLTSRCAGGETGDCYTFKIPIQLKYLFEGHVICHISQPALFWTLDSQPHTAPTILHIAVLAKRYTVGFCSTLSHSVLVSHPATFSYSATSPHSDTFSYSVTHSYPVALAEQTHSHPAKLVLPRCVTPVRPAILSHSM
jgi:hypothetical protein